MPAWFSLSNKHVHKNHILTVDGIADVGWILRKNWILSNILCKEIGLGSSPNNNLFRLCSIAFYCHRRTADAVKTFWMNSLFLLIKLYFTSWSTRKLRRLHSNDVFSSSEQFFSAQYEACDSSLTSKESRVSMSSSGDCPLGTLSSSSSYKNINGYWKLFDSL